MPSSGTNTNEPKAEPTEMQALARLPSRSAAAAWLVPSRRASDTGSVSGRGSVSGTAEGSLPWNGQGSPAATGRAAARPRLIDLRRSAAKAGLARPSTGECTKAGSP